MALTPPERADVRFYMGWPARFHQSDSRLEQAMNALATEPDEETLVLAAIASCKDIDTKLTDAHNRLKALKVGSIDLPAAREIRVLRSEGQRHASRIASTLGVEIRHNVFSGAPHRAATGWGGVIGGGNYAPHG